VAEPGANTTPGSAPFVGTIDTERDDNANETDNADDNALVLTRNQLKQVDDFRKQLLGTTDDAGKFQLCAEKCNELLRHNTGLQILIAAYDDVMSAACREYEKQKREKTRTPLPTGRKKKTDNNAVRDEWEQYFGVATHAA